MSELRHSHLDRLDGGDFDVLIVGGGINGAVAAASLAGRGASVALVERGDFAGLTSQETSHLVWGGFTYLENLDLQLVRKLCISRNRLMRAYPSRIRETRFLAALGETSPFPPWLAAAGAAAYWGIGSFRTSPPRWLSRTAIERLEPVIDTESVSGGIEYSDALLIDNDARFVFGFIQSALDSGATPANYVELVDVAQGARGWTAGLRDVETGAGLSCSARVVVNCAGPFVDPINRRLGVATRHRIVHSKGIHLVVDRITQNRRVLAFFDDTRRLFYVIPMGRRSVIGTTDTRVDEPGPSVTDEDRTFLLDQINARLDLDTPLSLADIIAEKCGTRPLVVRADDDAHQSAEWTWLSRKHEIEVDHHRGVVSVFGGKLTDCLNVGDEIAAAISELGVPLDQNDRRWFGEPDRRTRGEFHRQARGMALDDRDRRDGVDPLSDRLWRRYGRRAFELLDAIREDPSMGLRVIDASDYVMAELHHAARHEMVVRLDDFLRRRTSLSQMLPASEIRDAHGLDQVATVLFGTAADDRLREHFAR